MNIIYLLVFMSFAAIADQCISYKNTEIKGTLYRQTFPGAPNYESVVSGDMAETSFLLKLPLPKCVSDGKGGGELQENFDSVTDVQLVLTGQSTYNSLRPFIGKSITCKGNLFSAITGHHHTKVLLSEAFCH
ncbi:DUF4431 domain-containing protein [Sulfuricurvum sp. RIFCSPLOWO2_12_FULL_43_24]|uniref:DUF4431 domain-containing protein n=1 Tax=Sulfuricurvum sp. RIFCSPLOWO2_12_FULL_43_24 TaxID=1802247 RepID=UPI0008B5E012|nr:DUF4431 domain-containing protein [Sulfuricurvum sp. RIFCSPLOWO2_12_FULL_43_24]OHD85133.1 MAG: hypothetical protein A3I60_05100 [Sulfuricurvum sp. RIFCSPLOWO2_02_FULL_43_45]OHD90203.1 MAG: hypothetical protein A3G19_09825 [Sulfuricurvum sp. RIFCSPLOWO2_12_FULL_43_24]